MVTASDEPITAVFYVWFRHPSKRASLVSGDVFLFLAFSDVVLVVAALAHRHDLLRGQKTGSSIFGGKGHY